jgi:hypothetical protein
MAEDFAGFRSWAETNGQAMENWAQHGAGVMQRAADLVQEIMLLQQGWYRAGIEAWEELLACRGADDFFNCQQRLWEKTARQCFDEAGKILPKMIGLFEPALAPPAAPVAIAALPAPEPVAITPPAPVAEERPAERRRGRQRQPPG